MSIAPIQLLKLEGRDNTYAGLDDPRDKFVFLSAYDGGTGTKPLFPDTFAEGGLLVHLVDHQLYINTAPGGSVPSWTQVGGGTGNPAGLTTMVQYNNGGAFGADGDFVRATDGSFFGVNSVIATGKETRFAQDSNLFGIGIDGVISAYSDNGFSTSFLGTLFGDFTSVGGTTNSGIFGYQSFSGSQAAHMNVGYDSGTNEATVTIEASSTLRTTRIDIDTIGTQQKISFQYNGSDHYDFPTTAPTIGTALGYVSAHTLGWVSTAGGTPGGADTNIQFNNSNTFGGSSNFTWNDATQSFFAGDGSGGAFIQVLNSGGGDAVTAQGDTFAFEQKATGNIAFYVNASAANPSVAIGAVGLWGNQTYFEVIDGTKSINSIADIANWQPNAGNAFTMQFNGPAQTWAVGALSGAGNKTKFTLNDASGTIVNQTDGQFTVANSVGNIFLSIHPGSAGIVSWGDYSNATTGARATLDVPNSAAYFENCVPVYADDAAAILAGLTSGRLYKTTSGGSTVVKIVP